MKHILIACLAIGGFHFARAQQIEPSDLEWWGEDIAVSDSTNATELRAALKLYIWGDSGLDQRSTVDFRESIDLQADLQKEYFELPHLKSADKLTIHLRNGFTSQIYVLHPLKSNEQHIPVIYHSGHQVSFFHEDRFANDSGAYRVSVLDFFLDKGFDVIGISMPMVAYNYFPRKVREGGHIFVTKEHDDLFQLKNPFYYFLEPVRTAMDFLSVREKYQKFIMIGLSGGGWTTTVYSALDERIWLSFPVAGSIPMPLRVFIGDVGDKEQCLEDFYRRFNYSTLYALAAEGRGRLSCQILNEKDDCCFAINGANYWVPEVQARLAEMHQPGQFEFFLDHYAPFHKVSAVTTNKIYAEISDAFAREGHKL